jgi:flagellar biosynthesis protein FlhA
VIERLRGLRPEFLAAPVVLLLFVVILVPLPSLVLDALLVLNMGAAFLLLLLAVSTTDHAQLSVFPTLLLAMTLGRLSLNVASTRLILTDGTRFGGVIVRAFGDFVMGGSYAVGLILFAVLVTIQYFVVAKGSERVAEVAARFRLDSLPLKQMGIETRAQDGSLTPEEATAERRRLQQESDFYGAMDGASKFVKGETMAGFLVTAINFFGGLLLGLGRGDGSLTEVLGTFSLLTVGDGLVGLVPSLMLAVAAGFVITRTEGEGALSERVLDEFLQSHGAVGASFMGIGILVSILGLASGADPLGFLALAVIAFGISAVFLGSDQAADPRRAGAGGGGGGTAPVTLELHGGLLEALEALGPGAVEANLAAAADRLFSERGLRVAAPMARASADLPRNHWRLQLRGVGSGGGELDPDRYLAVFSGEHPGERLPGDPDRDPLGGRPALLIAPEAVGKAMGLGCDVMNPAELLGARVSEDLLASAAELCGFQETEAWIKQAAERYPAVVREVRAAHKLPEIQALLAALLAEGVSVRHPVRLLEALSLRAGLKGQGLVEAVRSDIARVIAEPLLGEGGELRALTLQAEVEAELKDSFREGEDGGEFLAISPDLAADLLSALRARSQALLKKGVTPVLLVSRRLRPHLYRFAAAQAPGLRVLAYDEVGGASVRVEARLGRFERAQVSMA